MPGGRAKGRRAPLRAGGRVAALCAGLLFAAACGGGAEEDFREEARAVCTEYGERIEAVGRPVDLEELEGTAGEIADLLEQQIAELRALEAPDELAVDYEQWLTLNEEAVENAREIQAAAAEADQERINELAGAAAQNALGADRLARDMELPECMVEGEDAGEPGDDDAPVVTVDGS